MIVTKEQWNSWIAGIIKELEGCDIKEERQSIADKLADLIDGKSERELLAASPLKIDLYNSLIKIGKDCRGGLEAAFHDYVNRNSYLDDADPLAPVQHYYPPCKHIFSLLPVGIKLSDGECEWYWTRLICNAPSFDLTTESGTNLLDYTGVYKDIDLTIAPDGQMQVTGNIDRTIIDAINDIYLERSQGRFQPYIFEGDEFEN